VDLSPDDAAWFGEVRSRRVERAAILVLADEWIGDAEASLARWRRWIPLLAGLAGFSLLTGLAGFSLTTGLARVLGVGWTALAGLVLGT
jgi:hypothetical protein